jgi:hypothetical protein
MRLIRGYVLQSLDIGLQLPDFRRSVSARRVLRPRCRLRCQSYVKV